MGSGMGLAMLAAGGILAVSWPRCGKDRAVGPANAAAERIPAGPSAALRGKLEQLTGAPTRVVWARDLGNGKDTFATGTQLVLMGLDTREAAGERLLTEAKLRVPLAHPAWKRC